MTGAWAFRSSSSLLYVPCDSTYLLDRRETTVFVPHAQEERIIGEQAAKQQQQAKRRMNRMMILSPLPRLFCTTDFNFLASPASCFPFLLSSSVIEVVNVPFGYGATRLYLLMIDVAYVGEERRGGKKGNTRQYCSRQQKYNIDERR